MTLETMTSLPTETPLVSIGMPVYNGAKLLDRALKSILSQTYRNIEIVISDNASKDDTYAIAQGYAIQDDRIRLIRHSTTTSALDNFHFVLSEARGKYFFWAPHDDFWPETFVAEGVRTLEPCPDAVGAMGTVHYVGKDGQEFLRHTPPYGLDAPDAYERISSYLARPVTDNLLYAFFCRDRLGTLSRSLSSAPEKINILEVLCRGRIVDSPRQEYFNHYSFKSKDEIAEVFRLPGFRGKWQIMVLSESLLVLRGAFPLRQWLPLSIKLIWKQRWIGRIAINLPYIFNFRKDAH